MGRVVSSTFYESGAGGGQGQKKNLLVGGQIAGGGFSLYILMQYDPLS